MDWVLIRPVDQIIAGEVVVQNNIISDHHTITFKINGSQPRPLTQKTSYRNYCGLDTDSFQTDLAAAFDVVLKSDAHVDGEELLRQYNLNTTSVLDKHAPMVERNKRTRVSQPWINDDILKIRQRRRALERQWQKRGLEVDKDMYKNQSRLVANEIKTAKAKYYTESLSDADTKTTFKILHSLQRKEENKLPKLASDQAICDVFSKFFIDKIDKIMTTIHDTVKSESISNNNNHDVNTLSFSPPTIDTFHPIDEEELKNIIIKGPSKPCSLDPLPTSLLKKTITSHLPILCQIINRSLKSGVFPAMLKTADVTLLIKKPSLDQDSLKNYRPVSNLAFTGKLIEKVVLRRLSKHMSDHGLGEPLQSAYRPKHSTETALMKVQHDISDQLDKGRGVALVLLDLSAAFDTINPDGVINTLEQHIGVKGVALSWFRNYLNKRNQRIRIGMTVSKPATLSRGVPQGSVLGPVLFTTYTIPIAAICKRHGVKYHIYADDTQLYIMFDPSIPGDREHALEKLKKCIQEIRAWMLIHELKLNDDKTEFIIFQSKYHENRYSTSSLNFQNIIFEPSDSVRNLGAYFDKYMTMERHVSELCRSSHYHLRQIGQIRKYLTRDACSNAVRSAVLSRLDYSNALLGGLRKMDLIRLQRVQNRAARLVTRTKTQYHITPVLRDLHWLPVSSRIDFKLCLYMYKALKKTAPIYISDELYLYEPKRPLRSSYAGPLYTVSVGRKEVSDFDFAIKGPRLWNSLPMDLRQAPSVMTFKKRLKTYLFKRHYYFQRLKTQAL